MHRLTDWALVKLSVASLVPNEYCCLIMCTHWLPLMKLCMSVLPIN